LIALIFIFSLRRRHFHAAFQPFRPTPPLDFADAAFRRRRRCHAAPPLPPLRQLPLFRFRHAIVFRHYAADTPIAARLITLRPMMIDARCGATPYRRTPPLMPPAVFARAIFCCRYFHDTPPSFSPIAFPPPLLRYADFLPPHFD